MDQRDRAFLTLATQQEEPEVVATFKKFLTEIPDTQQVNFSQLLEKARRGNPLAMRRERSMLRDALQRTTT